MPANLSGEVDPALVGFLQVAAARELHLAAAVDGDVERAEDREKDRLLTKFHSIQTKYDAVRYLRDVEKRYQRSQNPTA